MYLPHMNRPIEGGFRSTVGEYNTSYGKNKVKEAKIAFGF